MDESPRYSSPGRTLRGRLNSFLRRAWVALYKLARQKDRPERIALGLALGIFIGFLPIMGIQMAVVSIIALPLRANLKAAIAGVWISNPITFIPLYYANYRFGLLFLPARETDRETFGQVIARAADFSWSDIWGSVTNLFDFGAHILGPLWLGSAILGGILAVPTWFATRRFVIRYRANRAARRDRKAGA